jgi:hypothetical protein
VKPIYLTALEECLERVGVERQTASVNIVMSKVEASRRTSFAPPTVYVEGEDNGQGMRSKGHGSHPASSHSEEERE